MIIVKQCIDSLIRILYTNVNARTRISFADSSTYHECRYKANIRSDRLSFFSKIVSYLIHVTITQGQCQHFRNDNIYKMQYRSPKHGRTPWNDQRL